METGPKHTTDTDLVVVVGQGHQPCPGQVPANLARQPRSPDIHRIQVKDKHLRLMEPSQRERLGWRTSDPHELGSRLLDQEVDQRGHELGMVAGKDNSTASNSSSCRAEAENKRPRS